MSDTRVNTMINAALVLDADRDTLESSPSTGAYKAAEKKALQPWPSIQKILASFALTQKNAKTLLPGFWRFTPTAKGAFGLNQPRGSMFLWPKH